MEFSLSVTAILLAGAVVGLVPPLVDRLKTELGGRLSLTPAQTDRLAAVFYLAWLPGMPLAGWLIDGWIAGQQLLFYSLVAIVLGLAWLGLTRSLREGLANFAVLGLAYSGTATAAIHVMPHALAVAGSPVAALNLGFLPIGLGALVGPWLVGQFERRRALLFVGICVLALAGLVSVCPRDHFPARGPAADAALQYPQLGLIALALLLYFAIENCLDVWPEPYLHELGHGERGVRFGLTTFWAAFLAARLFVGIFGSFGFEAWLLLGLALMAALVLGNLVGAFAPSSGSLGFWAVGACYGPLLPGALALVPHVCPERPATALGMLLALSGLDTLLVRPALIAYAQRSQARALMRVPTLLALVLAGPLLVLALLGD